MGIGFREILIILIVALIVFGSRRVPDVMKDLAKGIQSFKEGLKGEDDKKPIEGTKSSEDSSNKA